MSCKRSARPADGGGPVDRIRLLLNHDADPRMSTERGFRVHQPKARGPKTCDISHARRMGAKPARPKAHPSPDCAGAPGRGGPERFEGRCDPRLRQRQSSVRLQHQGVGMTLNRLAKEGRARRAGRVWFPVQQRLLTDNELVSHFQNLGDRSNILITHEVSPIDSGQARYRAGGQNQKDIILLKIVIACGYFDCPLGIA